LKEKGHIFVDMNFYNNTMAKELFESHIIAHTCFDNEYYWATKEQYRGKGTSIYIVDVFGIKDLRQKVKDAEVVVIYLKADESTRYKRIVKARGNESLKRIEHDKEVFKIVLCDYVIDANRGIKEVLQDVKEVIRSKK
jgi:guanylate kinase